ncbi:MAG: molybdopterin-binding protein, partial [Halomonas sp.]|nr:molybdopterin-binding protein [Halomonas sp.]
MAHVHADAPFVPLNIAVLTVSDTRGFDQDGSGDLLCARLIEAGHWLGDRRIVPDDVYRIRAVVSEWIARDGVHAVLINGGTGFPPRDT